MNYKKKIFKKSEIICKGVYTNCITKIKQYFVRRGYLKNCTEISELADDWGKKAISYIYQYPNGIQIRFTHDCLERIYYTTNLKHGCSWVVC